MYTEYDTFLPSEKIAKEIFSDFNKDHTNLFRFMAYIYNEIELHLIKNKEQKLWYIQFLKIMSACFLPEFNYDKFKIVFNEIVSKFSALPDHIDSVPESTLVPVDVSYVGTSNRPHTI
jgi:signal transduction histidine kinase